MIFWTFLILYEIFVSLQMRQSKIISNKHNMCELPQVLPNVLRIRILEN